MQPAIASPLETTQRLDAEESARVLAAAIREGIGARVQVRGERGVYEGYAVPIGEDGAHLLLRCEGPWRAPSGETVARPFSDSCSTCGVHVVMEVGGARYVFDTRWVDEPFAGEPRMLRVLRPVALSMADRRRSLRRRLQQATEVVLHASGVSGCRPCRGAMLNLSPDGIACRISRRDAESLVAGRTVNVMFHLDGSDPAFNLQARITNITEGGTADQMVVGLEFIANADLAENRTRLHDVLKARR